MPKRHGLTIDPGVNIDFARDSYIYVEDGFIEINGLKDDNVYLSAKNKNWEDFTCQIVKVHQRLNMQILIM